jgi:metal-responsive CopG/Arc/MetJ family transcriptional regulator
MAKSVTITLRLSTQLYEELKAVVKEKQIDDPLLRESDFIRRAIREELKR